MRFFALSKLLDLEDLILKAIKPTSAFSSLGGTLQFLLLKLYHPSFYFRECFSLLQPRTFHVTMFVGLRTKKFHFAFIKAYVLSNLYVHYEIPFFSIFTSNRKGAIYGSVEWSS